jgi:hypothetical protein
LARIVAGRVAEPWAITEVDGADLSIDLIRSLEARYAPGRPIGGRGWALIINEAQNLRGALLGRLNTMLTAKGRDVALECNELLAERQVA